MIGELFKQYEQGLVLRLRADGSLDVTRSTGSQRDWLKANLQEVKRLAATPGSSWYGWMLEEVYKRTETRHEKNELQNLDSDLFAHGPVLETWPDAIRERFEKAVLRLTQALSGEGPELSGAELYRAVIEVFGRHSSEVTKLMEAA